LEKLIRRTSLKKQVTGTEEMQMENKNLQELIQKHEKGNFEVIHLIYFKIKKLD